MLCDVALRWMLSGVRRFPGVTAPLLTTAQSGLVGPIPVRGGRRKSEVNLSLGSTPSPHEKVVFGPPRNRACGRDSKRGGGDEEMLRFPLLSPEQGCADPWRRHSSLRM